MSRRSWVKAEETSDGNSVGWGGRSPGRKGSLVDWVKVGTVCGGTD